MTSIQKNDTKYLNALKSSRHSMNYSKGLLLGDNGINTRPIPKAELIAVAVFLTYFVIKASYFAFSIGENIFPDEITHFGLANLFSRSFLPPADSPGSYQFIPITTSPILYFYLMGKVLFLNIFPVSNLVFLRCINICISTLTVWFGWKFIRLLVSETAVRLLFVAMITNTLMFTFISGAVSYDNLTNCLAVLALYYLFSFFQSRSSSNFLLFVLFVSMGLLTKFTFLPYAFALLGVFLFHERDNLGFLPSAARFLFLPFRMKNYLLSFLCLFFIATATNLFLGNLFKYGKLQPSMDEALGFEQALHNRAFASYYILRLFKEGNVSYSEAQNMAFTHIKHLGDRYSTLDILEGVLRNWNTPRIDRFRYAFVWSDIMLQRTFGILAHRSMAKSDIDLMPYLVLLSMAGGLLIRRINAFNLSGSSIYLLFIAGFYALILMQLVNYKLYFSIGVIPCEIQGRYIFPVVTPIYVLVAYYLTGFGSKLRQWCIFLTVTAIFVLGEFPWFLQRVPPGWFFGH